MCKYKSLEIGKMLNTAIKLQGGLLVNNLNLINIV
jgi:hypothetical protein